MSVRVAEYFGHNVRSTVPLALGGGSVTCPFSGRACSKYPRHEPVCSVWIEGIPERLYPVCQDRFITAEAAANVMDPHLNAKMHQVANCIWNGVMNPDDISVTFNKTVDAGSKVDCIIRRRMGWEVVRFPNGFLVEIQASGDTNDTGIITRFIRTLTVPSTSLPQPTLPNGLVTAGTPIATTSLSPSPNYKNVYKRAMMQVLSKGSMAMANDLGMALVVNSVFLERLHTEYHLPHANHNGRDVVVFVPVDIQGAALTHAPIDLSVIPAQAVRLQWSQFVEWCSEQGRLIDIGGDYSDLSGGTHTLD